MQIKEQKELNAANNYATTTQSGDDQQHINAEKVIDVGDDNDLENTSVAIDEHNEGDISPRLIAKTRKEGRQNKARNKSVMEDGAGLGVAKMGKEGVEVVLAEGEGGGGGGGGGSSMKHGGASGGGRGPGGRGGGRGLGGMSGGSRVVVEPHRHEGVFIANGNQEALCTKNMVPGEAVYNEKRISVQNEDGSKVEYRVWNPFCSKLAAATLGGVDDIWIKPGAHVLYLGAASGTSVSHVSDIARILALNASHYLKAGGHFVISIKANCIDSTVSADAVFKAEAKKLQLEQQLKPREQVTLEPYERDHACVVGTYRVPKKQKVAAA
ncbi:hypothetical protein RND71_024427 [Anisodus tanguticus]|uniref:Fibrillarin n=1 Tax=Anisodus tanguticus TaxID=243964 RepID=A0AAE1RPL8_9SOLA|nr:hypothetical protein RND71_024427 [Anisodus tanguticus]